MPIDASSYSKAAIAFIASRATLIKSQPDVELLNVQHRVPLRAARALGKEMVLSYHESEANRALKPALTSLKKADLRANARYVVGTVANELAAIVAADAADLIVMGSHGDTGLRKLLLGSVTSTVMASCATPMLVMRGKLPRKKDSLKLAIALDGSKYGVAAVRFFIKHRDFFGAAPTVTLVHVVPDLSSLVVPGFLGRVPVPNLKPEQMEAMQSAAFENAMAPARKLLERAGVTATEVRLSGNNPGDQIAAYAAKNKLDLIALGSHGQGALKSAVLGSVATRITAKCQVPLLFVREK
ncbi:MAG: universal stress protein [Burkholderiaceae bacterium]|nr:universal stress protein [Burkholderiaceae bacterium]